MYYFSAFDSIVFSEDLVLLGLAARANFDARLSRDVLRAEKNILDTDGIVKELWKQAHAKPCTFSLQHQTTLLISSNEKHF